MARAKAKEAPGIAPDPDDDGESIGEFWERQPAGRIVRGVYSVWKTEEGGMHIAYRPDGAGEDSHLPLPPMLVAMMTGNLEGAGPLAKMAAKLASMRGLGQG